MGHIVLVTNGLFAIALIMGIPHTMGVSLHQTVILSAPNTQTTEPAPTPPGPTPVPPINPSPGPTDPTPQPTEPIPGPESPVPTPPKPPPPSPDRGSLS